MGLLMYHFTTVHGPGLDAATEQTGRQLGIYEPGLLYLVHRADVSRLQNSSGGAVKRLWVMGYRCLEALRTADPQQYTLRIAVCFTAGGKGTTFDAKMTTIVGFLNDARHAPKW
jgi:hypothetical protein